MFKSGHEITLYLDFSWLMNNVVGTTHQTHDARVQWNGPGNYDEIHDTTQGVMDKQKTAHG